VVDIANEGVAEAGFQEGLSRAHSIEMGIIQVPGDYLVLAKDAATAERLIKNGPR